MIELRKRIRKILRREKVSGTAGKALGVASPVVAVAHSGQRSQVPATSIRQAEQYFMFEPRWAVPPG